MPVTINAPKLVSTAVETDVNGANMLRNESILHTLTLTNTGTATGTNIAVTIPWSISGASYIPSSFLFGTGTFAATGTFMIDEILGRITFTLPYLPPGASDTYTFRTMTTGPV